jgi:predicted nucleic acid-binding protein
MIVVADTSPISYLVLIKEIDILPKIYGAVVVPEIVARELRQQSAPEMVRAWVADAPSWLQIRVPIQAPDPSLAKLDAGERDAILLATELKADRLIVDDQEGRKRAQERRIPVIGTLGVLKAAATLGLLDLRRAVSRLQSTNFHVTPAVLKNLLQD